MKNIPLSSVCYNQYVMVYCHVYLYIGKVTVPQHGADLSIETIWTNHPSTPEGKITRSNFYNKYSKFQIFYKSSFPLDYDDLQDILQDYPELLI